MEKQEILDGNKLIVEFICGKIYRSDFEDHRALSYLIPAIPQDKIVGENKLLFHSSWDWLMPVVEKIGKDYDIRLTWVHSAIQVTHIDRRDIYDDCIADVGGYEPVILNTWLCVVKFIKWYNSKKS